MMMVSDIAGVDVHGRLDVMMHRTVSWFAGVYIYTELFVPTGNPLIFHWYIGRSPPLMGVACKETIDPSQTGFVDASMETLTAG
jgi:hypothetical protein